MILMGQFFCQTHALSSGVGAGDYKDMARWRER